MIGVELKILFGRSLFGCSELLLEMNSDSTVHDAIWQAGRLLGDAFIGLVWDADAGSYYRHIRVFLDDQELPGDESLDRRGLREGSIITLIPAAAGGSIPRLWQSG